MSFPLCFFFFFIIFKSYCFFRFILQYLFCWGLSFCFFFCMLSMIDNVFLLRGHAVLSKPSERCVKWGFGYNHKFMIIRFRSRHLALWLLGNLWYLRVWVKDLLCKEKIYHPQCTLPKVNCIVV
jgi:hypothetical protein